MLHPLRGVSEEEIEMKQMTKADWATWRAYDEADPKAKGNLHERMKYLIELFNNVDLGLREGQRKVWHAIIDLETEVGHYQPADPPFGRRTPKHDDVPSSAWCRAFR